MADRRPYWNRLARSYNLQLPLERPALRVLLELLGVKRANASSTWEPAPPPFSVSW